MQEDILKFHIYFNYCISKYYY